MTDQNVWWGNRGAFEQSMKFFDHALGRSRHGTQIAPTQSGAVVANDAIRLRECTLDFAPAEHGRHQSRFEDNRGASLPCVQHMYTMRSQVNELARTRMQFSVAAQAELLVQRA